MSDSPTGTHLPWADGMPTRPDVDALVAAFPPATLTPGVRILDAKVLAVIGNCTTNRFRTVYSAWMRRLAADHRVVLKRWRESGFFVPTPAEVLADTQPTLRHIGRCAGSQMRKLAIIKPADGVEADTRDHHGRLLSVIKRESKKARTNILPPSVAPTSPQITPPTSSEDKRPS